MEGGRRGRVRDTTGVDLGSDWLAFPGLWTCRHKLESLEIAAVGHIMCGRPLGEKKKKKGSIKSPFCKQH